MKMETYFTLHAPGQIHKRHGHFANQILVFLVSTTSPEGEHYNFPEWYWTSVRTVAHEGDDPHEKVLYPISAEGSLGIGRCVLE